MANMFQFIREQSVSMDGFCTFTALEYGELRQRCFSSFCPSHFFPVHKIAKSLTNDVKIMSFKFYLQKTSTAIQASNINNTKRLATLSKRLKAEYSDKQHPLLLCI